MIGPYRRSRRSLSTLVKPIKLVPVKNWHLSLPLDRSQCQDCEYFHDYMVHESLHDLDNLFEMVVKAAILTMEVFAKHFTINVKLVTNYVLHVYIQKLLNEDMYQT